MLCKELKRYFRLVLVVEIVFAWESRAGFPGKSTFGRYWFAETGLPFRLNFPQKKIREVGLVDVGVEAER